jgi:hypothetical protein
MDRRRAVLKYAAGLGLLASVLFAAHPVEMLFAEPAGERQVFSERWRHISPAPAQAAQSTSETAPTTAPTAPKPAASPVASSGDKPAALPVSLDQALYLIRTTLLTLNDANRSGNYTVLRDLAASDFQTNNSAADLAQSFADLRRRRFDLFAAALAAPQLISAPALDAQRRLRLQGFFPTRPLQINFDLLFQNVGGQWRLFGISVVTPEAPAQAQTTPTTPRQSTRMTSR